MKHVLSLTVLVGSTLIVMGQSPLNEEMLQARMHYMNEAKVSYLASVEQPIAPDWVYNNVNIPTEIKTAFKDKYPQASDEQWMLKEDRYKVNFRSNGEARFAYLDRRGHWIKTFTKQAHETVPQQVTDYLNKHYQDYTLTKFYLKDTPNGSGYTLALKKAGTYIWLEFDLDGKVIRDQA